jgi:hypothetical protein
MNGVVSDRLTENANHRWIVCPFRGQAQMRVWVRSQKENLQSQMCSNARFQEDSLFET